MTGADPDGASAGHPGSPPLFDSHLHLTDARFDADRVETLERARAAGVAEMVTIGTEPGDARAAIRLARAEPGVWATAGLHPHEADRFGDGVRRALGALLAEPEAVAVGETGLDYHYENAPREAQRASFRAHLELAAASGLPVVVHSRDADDDTAGAIRDAEGDVVGVLHCFTGGWALLEAGLACGWLVSFSGIATFAEELADAVRAVPDERLLIETDSPYLAPVPKRGRRNEPAFLRFTCERIAALRGTDPAEVARLTRSNARRFYRIEPAPAPARGAGDGASGPPDGSGAAEVHDHDD